MFQRMNAAPRMGDGNLALRTVQSVGELKLGDDDLRDFAVIGGAEEVPARVRLENDVQHHIVERGIGRVPVRVPCGGIRIELKRAGLRLAIDLHSGFFDVRNHPTGGVVATIILQAQTPTNPTPVGSHSTASLTEHASSPGPKANNL